MKIIWWAYTSSSSVSTCISYENNSSYKWWRYANTVSPGFAWDASDYSTPWGGSLWYKCSSDSTYSSAINSKKLLCPTDYTYCNSQV